MSKPKTTCGSRDGEQKEGSVQLKEEPGQCDQAPHLQHTQVPESPRKSEVCTLEAPPESNRAMCGRQMGNEEPTDNRKMECRVIDDEETSTSPPKSDECPKPVSKCAEKGGK